MSRGEEDWIPLMEQVLEAVQGPRSTTRVESVDRTPRPPARALLGIDPKTGKPWSRAWAATGRCAQIGTAEDEDKPKFASLRPGQSMHTITLDDALELFKLPRKLGAGPTARSQRRRSAASARSSSAASTYASLEQGDDPYTIELNARAELIAREGRGRSPTASSR